jgi:2-succinyl-5-enolpyruvyl-6-hydroxy-3-cyclohexene-1-carboxylate synthase
MRLQPVYDIAELCAQHGVTQAVVCPGSRCAPLTLAFARHPRIQVRTVSDERSAAFIALGMAQASLTPVVLICTSGTAAYNFAPAVAEAFYQQIPLIVLTADRPTEWVGQRDGQTIVQTGIYGAHTKYACQLPESTDHADARWSFYRLVNTALLEATSLPMGPVHINVPLREPLYPKPDESIQFSREIPRIDRARIDRVGVESLWPTFEGWLRDGKKILLVAGQLHPQTGLTEALEQFTEKYNVPLTGDITSNLHTVGLSCLHADTFLMGLSDAQKQRLAPDVLVTLGRSVVAKNLKLFLRGHKAMAHWHIEPGNALMDPYQSMTLHVPADPAAFFEAMVSREAPRIVGRSDYLKAWTKLEGDTQERLQVFFEDNASTELGWVYRLMQQVPNDSDVHLANSMAIRYGNWVGIDPLRKVQVFCNRGTSGIDGCTSTAVGHSLATQRITTLLTGDMAFFYDRNAFWHNEALAHLRIVILNNQGGAIFGIIDGPADLPEAPSLFITQQRLTADHLAREFGLAYERVDRPHNAAEAADLLKRFYEPAPRAKVLEIASSASQAREVFQLFKQHIKQSNI